MRKILVPAVLAALVGAPFVVAVSDSSALPATEMRYIVGFHGAVPEDVRPGEAYLAGEVLWIDEDLRFAVVRTAAPATLQADALLDPRVRYVEWDNPAYAVLSFVPNDSRYGDAGHYGSKIIGGEAAWDKTRGSTSIKVGMLDSGIVRNHEDVTGSRLLQGYDFVNNDNEPNDESGCSWHGSHTTGTAGATINNGKGIAGMSQHTILPVKAFYPSFFGCSGSTTALVSGLKYIADQGSHISSNSWGGGTSTAINDAIDYAHAKGTIHVSAAGNSGACTNCVSDPWKTKSSITIVVSSTDSADKQSSFSSEGPEVDVAAPGTGILSICGTSTSCYQALSGTSMATPHVAGTAALVKAVNPGFTFADMDSCLKNTAKDLGAAGKDDDFGFGRIQANLAVNCGGGTPPPPPPACNDGADNDGDGKVDYPADPGCSSSTDTDETDAAPSPACSDGVDNDGDGKVDYPADPGCSSSTDNDETDPAPPPGESRVYFENMDDGAQGWTKSSAGDLWHTTGACVAPIGARHLAWTQDAYCDYYTGGRVTNWARSGAISLSGKTQATLNLKHQFDIEQESSGAYDILRIQVSKDGSTWTTLRQWDSRNADVTSWTALSFDIDAFTGGNLYVRFWTDTVDSLGNFHKGWFIEDVEITAA